jgi:long-chain fatty acid transport protein
VPGAVLLVSVPWLPSTGFAAGPVFVDLGASASDARIAAGNPAGMTRLDETAWRSGLIVSYSESTWEVSSDRLGISTETDADSTLFVPSLFYVTPLGERWALGASLSATSGLGNDSGEDSASRYLSTDWSLGSFTFQPSIAYALDDAWSLGVGVGVNYTVYSWEAAVFNGIGQPDGRVKAEPDDIALNYVLGVHWQPAAGTRLGLSWRSDYQPEMQDSPDYSNVDPGREATGDLDLEVSMPQSLLAGVHHRFDSGQWLSFDLIWLEASEFNIESAVVDEGGGFAINPYNLDDVWAASLGWGMPWDRHWSMGVGLLYVDDPIEDDNRSILLRPDSLWGIGASVDYTRDSGMTIGANLSWLDTGSAPVTTPVLPVIGSISGEFTDRTNLLFEFYISW